jgi:hypothetical protein
MPYIGNASANRFVASKAATQFSGDGSTTVFTLDHSVGSDEDILVSVDGVIQEPSVAYAVSNGTTLTFTAAPSSNSGNNIFVYYLFRTVATVDHPSTSALSATSGTFSTDLTVSGNTGMGETSPLGKLHVKSGDSGASSVNGNANELVVENSDYAGITILGENETSIMFGDNEDPDVGRIEYFHSTNSMSFRTNASDAMVIDGNGHVTKPNQSAFLARPSARQANLAINTTHTIVFDSEIFDQNADFSSNTFTAPVTGKYQLNVQLLIQQMDTATDFYYINLKTSNRNYDQYWDNDDKAGDNSNGAGVSVVALADMDAGDTAYIEIIVPNSGAAQMDVETASAFSGYLVA